MSDSEENDVVSGDEEADESNEEVLIDFSLTVKGVTLIFISGCCSACLSDKQEKSALLSFSSWSVNLIRVFSMMIHCIS